MVYWCKQTLTPDVACTPDLPTHVALLLCEMGLLWAWLSNWVYMGARVYVKKVCKGLCEVSGVFIPATLIFKNFLLMVDF